MFMMKNKIQEVVMDRTLIRVGTKKVGDEIRGKKITGLGKEFVKFIRDDEACAYALQPGRDYRIRMQYAYFN